MKIIQVTPYYPPHFGGMEQRIKELCQNLSKKGYNVEVLTSCIGYKACVENDKNLKIHYLRTIEFAQVPFIPALFFSLMRIPKDSIMHVHIAQAFVPEMVMLVSKLRGIPYVAHVRIDIQPSSFFGFLIPVYKRLVLSKVLKNSKEIIVLTNDYKDIISRKYGLDKQKIIVIPNATNFKIFKRKSYDFHNPIRLLYVGRLAVQKNIFSLLTALSNIVKYKSNVELHIVGKGEMKNGIETFVKNKSLQKNVILHGELHGMALINKYRTSDIFLLPSFTEVFSTTLLEAMANGLPIIASKIPGTTEILGKGKYGLLVDPDAKNIEKGIIRLIRNKKYARKLSYSGYERIKKFQISENLRSFEQLYGRIK